MPKDEFVAAYGPPRDPVVPSDAVVEAAKGRLPEELIQLWQEHGLGWYADRNYWLCAPNQFDDYLAIVLKDVEGVEPASLAAYGYSCLGSIDLWQEPGREYSYDLATGLLMDATSLQETASVPYDVEDLMAMAGVPPERARETFLASRTAPRDIWMALDTAVDPEGYKMIFSDSGRSLIAQLRQAHGRLERGEIYLRYDLVVNEAASYRRVTLERALTTFPREVRFTRYIEVGGEQEPSDQIVPVRR